MVGYSNLNPYNSYFIQVLVLKNQSIKKLQKHTNFFSYYQIYFQKQQNQ